MTYSQSKTETPLHPAMENELLALADTKLVLGNWYSQCVENGRSLPDFAAILGMCTANYGHTRAIYQFMAAHGHSYPELERGRGPEQIRSMNLLDQAPTCWEDFILTTWLTELSTWMMISGFLKHSDRTIAGLAKKVGQETYFHLKYATGWFQIISEGAEETARFQEAFARRYPLALQWFGPANAADELSEAGQRDVPVAKLKEAFIREVMKATDAVGLHSPASKDVAIGSDWRTDARRAGALPDGLYEVVRFKDADIAH